MNPPPAAERLPPLERHQGSDPEAHGHLLVVEDSAVNRKMLQRHLEQQGYTVALAENGVRALEMMRALEFDLILLDIIMPEMDGYQVLQYVKQDPHLRHIPIIMISDLEQLDSVVKCIELGAEDHLPKSFNPTLLRARIGACLEKKRLRDQEVMLFQQLQENYQRLRELESLRDSLTHMIVHDLRTPLTSLIGGLDMVQKSGELNLSQAECLAVAWRGGNTLLGLINDLLDIGKMESGTLKLDYRDSSADDIVEQSVAQVEQLMKEKQLDLQVELAPDLPPLCVDMDLLVRTLVNLLGNAVKFTPRGGWVRLEVALDSSGMMLFSVSDSGEGIPPEAIERIFEKFSQVESRQGGRKMSTGLGLTFCKMAVEAHSGRIWATSEHGAGSTFAFIIPPQPVAPGSWRPSVQTAAA